MPEKIISFLDGLEQHRGNDAATRNVRLSAISRSFERLEERIDAGESRIYSRLTDIEDGIGEELKAVRLAVVGEGEGVVAKE